MKAEQKSAEGEAHLLRKETGITFIGIEWQIGHVLQDV